MAMTFAISASSAIILTSSRWHWAKTKKWVSEYHDPCGQSRSKTKCQISSTSTVQQKNEAQQKLVHSLVNLWPYIRLWRAILIGTNGPRPLLRPTFERSIAQIMANIREWKHGREGEACSPKSKDRHLEQCKGVDSHNVHETERKGRTEAVRNDETMMTPFSRRMLVEMGCIMKMIKQGRCTHQWSIC